MDIIKFTRDTPAAEGLGTRTNLLTVTFTGSLSGHVGGHHAGARRRYDAGRHGHVLVGFLSL